MRIAGMICRGTMVSVRLLTNVFAGSLDRWYWTGGAFSPRSFCIRALVLDGLAIPPFDRHTDGDGRLRELGLDAETWHAWVASVLRQHAIMGEHARTLGSPEARGPLLERALAAAKVISEPG